MLDVRGAGGGAGALVARHEVLRTRLVAGADGVPYQVIDPPGRLPLPVADVSGAAGSGARRLRGLVAADAVAPFDLAAGPLVRACLVRLGAAEHVLALRCITWCSMSGRSGFCGGSCSALYEAFRAGEPAALPPLPVQYADFAVWQRWWLAGEVLEGQLAYWRERLAGLAVLELPLDRPAAAGAVRRGRGDRVRGPGGGGRRGCGRWRARTARRCS